jgi:methionyl aminopeptidase
MSVIKNPAQVKKMRKAGSLLSDVLNMLKEKAVVGISGKEIDLLAENAIRDGGAIPAFKNYGPRGLPPYPASICFSRNHVLVHGVPTKEDIIEEGDVVSIDCGLSLNGWFADAARLFGVGQLAEEDQKIIQASEEAINAGIDKCREGYRLGDICNSIQISIALNAYENVLQFCGHAIGKEMHELPQVPNYGKPNQGPRLREGMVFCLEPMLKKTKTKLGILSDKWTVVTLDQSRATHIEEMVLITSDEPEVLTA